MPTTRLIRCALLSLLTATAAAQLPGPGLTWAGSSGGNAGSFLPSCANLPVTAVAGETVTLRIWGDPQALFALFAATSGHQCLPVPGLGNALVLDPPLLTVAFGVLTLFSPCLSCPPAFQELRFTIPPNVPPGSSVSFQAASFGAGNPSFTVAVTGTV